MLRELAESALRRRGPDHPDYARALADLAGGPLDAGRPADAARTIELSLAIYGKLRMPREQVSALLERGHIRERTGDRPGAIASYREALDVITVAGAVGGDQHAEALRRLGEAAQARGDAATAEQSLSAASETLRKLGAAGTPRGLFVAKLLAEIRLDAGDVKGALAWVDRGLAAASRTEPGRAASWRPLPEVVDQLDLKGEILLRAGPQAPAVWKEAYRNLEAAGEVADRVRAEQRSTDESKAGVLDRARYEAVILRLMVCEMLAGAEPGGGWLAAAFRTAEESRARVFLEQLGRSRAGVVGGLPAELAARESALLAEQRRLDREIAALEVAPFDRRDPARMAGLLAEAGKAARQMDELQGRIAREYPRIAALRRPNPCTVDEARACLAAGEVAVIFACGEKLCDALIVRPPAADDPVGLALIPVGGPGEFADALAVLTDPEALAVRALYEPAAAEVYRALIAPIEGHIRGKDLVIVPDGSLALLPFETLRDPSGRFLVEGHRIRYAPSLTALSLNRAWESKRRRPSRPLLALGDPIYSAGDPRLAAKGPSESGLRAGDRPGMALPRLAGTSREVAELGRLLGAPADDLWTGAAASEARRKAASADGSLAEYRFLHLATHGLLDAGPGRPPALVLSLVAQPAEGDPPGDDGLLTLGEVGALRLNADLVVLSACGSGLGRVRAGEGVTGLARAFLSAGTRGLVCSLWEVDDREAARAMVDLYRRLGTGRPPTDALRDAKLKAIHGGAPPSLWAPFILIGE